MSQRSLTDKERAALAGLMRQAIERDRFPLSARVRELKAILAKLNPPAWVNSSIGRRKRR
jgi:hypothetical protein